MTYLSSEKEHSYWSSSTFADAVYATIARLLAPKPTEEDLLKKDLNQFQNTPKVQFSHPLFNIPFIKKP